MRAAFLLLVLVLAGAAQAQVARVPAPVAWWRLDGDGADAMGRHAAVVVGCGVDRHGRAGAAWPFGCGSGPLTAAHADALDFDLRQESYTLSLWVRGTSGRLARVVQKWDERAATPYAYSLQAGPDGLDAVVSDPPRVYVARVRGVWDGAWHHVAVRFDARTSDLDAFLDGAHVGRVRARVRRSTRNTAPLTLGGAEGVDRDFGGDLDDVRLWRRALTDAQIAALARS